MYTNQLINALKKFKWSKKYFCGVKSLDNVPQQRVRRPCAFVVNTDTSDKPGQHWFAVFVPRRGPIEYFDSFGRPPSELEISTLIRMNGGRYKYNTHRIQSDQSQNCGQFSLCYLLFRLKNYTMNQFIKFFSTIDYEYNDKLIENLYKRLIL